MNNCDLCGTAVNQDENAVEINVRRYLSKLAPPALYLFLCSKCFSEKLVTLFHISAEEVEEVEQQEAIT